MECAVKWIGGMTFVGKTNSGHTVVMDAPQESGGENLAPTPMELLLIALGGCTGMDIVSLLKKMREDLTEFVIQINGERQEEHPRIYKKIDLVYKFQGKDLNKKNIEKAVSQSFDKYCSVGAMLKLACPITYRIEIR